MRLRTALFVLLVLLPALAASQFTVVSTVPSNGATGVLRNSTIVINFSGPVDTTKPFSNGGSFMTNIQGISNGHWSADRQTFFFDAALDSNTVYFIAVFGAIPAAGGFLTTAYGFNFTTGASYPANTYSVSGTLSGGTTGLSPANAIVGLSSNGVGGQHGPDLIAGTITDAGGNFTIPYVPAGSWTPISAKDANEDGQIDPSTGDALAIGSLVTVTNTNVSGVSLVFQSYPPLTFAAAKDSALAYATAHLPADYVLHGISGENVDSAGRANDWSYYYNTPEDTTVQRLFVEPFRAGVDMNTSGWNHIGRARVLNHLNSAAPADSFFAHIERQGGQAFRMSNPSPDSLSFYCQVKLGDLRNTEYSWLIPDTSKNYWAATYAFERQITRDSSDMVKTKFFIGDFNTANLLVVTSVKEPPTDLTPTGFTLEQNYPNPFNPTTVISGQWSVTSVVRLAVYDILGREVAVVAHGSYPAGKYSFTFNASTLSSGVYFYRLTAGSFTAVKKMSLIK